MRRQAYEAFRDRVRYLARLARDPQRKDEAHAELRHLVEWGEQNHATRLPLTPWGAGKVLHFAVARTDSVELAPSLTARAVHTITAGMGKLWGSSLLDLVMCLEKVVSPPVVDALRTHLASNEDLLEVDVLLQVAAANITLLPPETIVSRGVRPA
eukprot:Sspe_Gene.118821::Locus_113210_Transcript_1_1_Confidence_1.000_Length_515::g.118821::m.118821